MGKHRPSGRRVQPRVDLPVHNCHHCRNASLARLKLVGERPRDIPDIVANAYPGLDQRLVPAAGGSVLAHLVDLQRRGLVTGEGEEWALAA